MVNNSEESNKRLYLVFIHYPLKQKKKNNAGVCEGDWDWMGRRITVENTAIHRLADDLCYLREVLKPREYNNGQTWEGFAFVFLDPGWTKLLAPISDTPLAIATLGASLVTMQSNIVSQLEHYSILGTSDSRERIVTASNLLFLLDLLDKAAQGRGESFYRLFAGGAQTLKYDAPKVVEAAIRIANNGCGLPLFRFDDDVIFYGQRSPNRDNRNSDLETTANGILELCARYQSCLDNPRIRYFMYSGGYDSPTNIEVCPNNDPQLLNGFSTRVLQLTQLPETARDLKIENITEGTIHATVIKAFLEDDLKKLGANPLRQVISGAGLCLSDGAILDLPPYSNMRLNVLWIDDHLKYALHDELDHFGRWARTHHHYKARVPSARFLQLRHLKSNNQSLFTYKDVRWHLQKYMRRLILGCIADAWLRKIWEVKESTDKDLSEYNTLLRSIPHIYGNTFMEVLPGGWNAASSVDQFKQNLWEQGRNRLEKIVECWNKDIYKDTFLGLFVSGDCHPRYNEFAIEPSFFPPGFPDGLSKAVRDLPRQYQQPPDPVPQNPNLEQSLGILVDDFVAYLSFVQFWPVFVQSVRLLQNQHARYRSEELEWMFPILKGGSNEKEIR